MSRTPISLKSLFKSAANAEAVALRINDGAIPPPPRWDDHDDSDAVMAARTQGHGRARSVTLGRRRSVAMRRRVA